MAKALERTIHNLSMDSDDEHVAGFAAKHRSLGRGAHVSRERKRSSDLLSDLAIQNVINQRIAELEERIEWLDVRIAQLRSDMEMLEDKLTKSRDRIQAIDSAIAEFHQAGAFGEDEDDGLSSAVQQILMDYQKRTGRTVDVTDRDAVLLALRVERDFESTEGQALESELSEVAQRHDAYQAEFKQATSRLDALKRGDPEAIKEELAREAEPSDTADFFNQLASADASAPEQQPDSQDQTHANAQPPNPMGGPSS